MGAEAIVEALAQLEGLVHEVGQVLARVSGQLQEEERARQEEARRVSGRMEADRRAQREQRELQEERRLNEELKAQLKELEEE